MNLTDYFLIAMPGMDDPFFADSVVYICEHNENGALGIVINKPSPVKMDWVFEAAGTPTPERFQHEWVVMGGPLQLDRGFVLHTPPGNWQSSLLVNEEVAMTTSRDILGALGQPDRVVQAVVSIGYSSWSHGQLEQELADNAWLTVPADHNILFDLPYAVRYEAAFAKLGIEPASLMEGAGHA